MRQAAILDGLVLKCNRFDGLSLVSAEITQSP